MRVKLVGFLLGLLGSGVVFCTSAYAIEGFVTVTSPNGGTFTEGDTMNISWDSSSNIDKVSIMIKTDQHHGSWVAFSTPNTKSYSWKVDVGNTTNTQFYIEITGWQTGAGSTTAFGNYFTVNQKADAPVQPSTAPAPTTTSSQTSGAQPQASPPLYYDRTTNQFTYSPPTNTTQKTTANLSIYNLTLWSEFVFDGSKTTDLKAISNAKAVEHFTLDTKEGYTFIFEEPLNLTETKNLNALKNAQEYWQLDPWFVWIEWEWWIKYDVTETITVEYKNEDLTAFAPTIDSTQTPSPSPNTLSETIRSKHKTPSILGSETGKVKLALNDGTPVKIKPRVELEGDETMHTKRSVVSVAGHTSHANLSYMLKKNGEVKPITPVLDADSGAITFDIQGLSSGNNTLRFYYQEKDGEPVEFGEKNIVYTPTLWSLYGQRALEILILACVFIAGMFFPQLRRKLKYR